MALHADARAGERPRVFDAAYCIMPKVGIEPTIPKEHDFESCASASSATSARPAQYNTGA